MSPGRIHHLPRKKVSPSVISQMYVVLAPRVCLCGSTSKPRRRAGMHACMIHTITFRQQSVLFL